MTASTEPGEQWAVERELRRRLLLALNEHGMPVPYPKQVVAPAGGRIGGKHQWSVIVWAISSNCASSTPAAATVGSDAGGMDFRIKCLGCGHQVMISRPKFEKSVKNRYQSAEETAP